MRDHKIVCWGYYAFPVDEKYNLLTFDDDGLWLYEDEPYFFDCEWITTNDQLYWIG